MPRSARIWATASGWVMYGSPLLRLLAAVAQLGDRVGALDVAQVGLGVVGADDPEQRLQHRDRLRAALRGQPGEPLPDARAGRTAGASGRAAVPAARRGGGAGGRRAERSATWRAVPATSSGVDLFGQGLSACTVVRWSPLVQSRHRRAATVPGARPLRRRAQGVHGAGPGSGSRPPRKRRARAARDSPTTVAAGPRTGRRSPPRCRRWRARRRPRAPGRPGRRRPRGSPAWPRRTPARSSARRVAAGSLPFLRTGTNPACRWYATGAARMNPRASMPTTASTPPAS